MRRASEAANAMKKAKPFLIELTAFVCLILALVKIIVTEAHQLFR